MGSTRHDEVEAGERQILRQMGKNDALAGAVGIGIVDKVAAPRLVDDVFVAPGGRPDGKELMEEVERAQLREHLRGQDDEILAVREVDDRVDVLAGLEVLVEHEQIAAGVTLQRIVAETAVES